MLLMTWRAAVWQPYGIDVAVFTKLKSIIKSALSCIPPVTTLNDSRGRGRDGVM